MPSKPTRCAGGCGRTQSMTVETKEPDAKTAYTVAQRWLCPECQEKKRKRDEAAKAKAAATPPQAAPAAATPQPEAKAPGAGAA